jgi:two-component system, NtrC family, nitrogen regulation sensor histidine kinase GlnL
MTPPAGASNLRRHVEHDAVLAALPQPILVIAEDGRVLYANASAELFFSTSSAVLRRGALTDVLPFDSPLLATLDQVRRTRQAVNEYGVDVVSLKTGAVNRLVDVYAGPIPEEPTQILVMLQQRSMAQMIERQLTHRAAARSVSGLAAVLAHEIKNPLSGIRGAAQLLEQNLTPEDRQLSQLICDETDRIRNLVDRMEVFGDERPLETSQVNVHSVLDHVKTLARSGFARDIRIVEDYDPSLPPITANREKLIQALLNLIKNAAEAISEVRNLPNDQAAEPGRIILRTAFRPGVRMAVPGTQRRVSLPFMIEIEDNGSGIRDEMKSHLFDPFVTTKRTGTGLGLALVAKIIGDHGGIIEFEGVPRRTVFRVLLPIDGAKS